MGAKDSPVTSKSRTAGLVGVRLGMTLAEVEKVLITAILHGAADNVSRSAAMLAIDRSTLYQKIRRYSIKVRRSRITLQPLAGDDAGISIFCDIRVSGISEGHRLRTAMWSEAEQSSAASSDSSGRRCACSGILARTIRLPRPECRLEVPLQLRCEPEKPIVLLPKLAG